MGTKVMITCPMMGPGWLMFFQNPCPGGSSGGGGGPSIPQQPIAENYYNQTPSVGKDKKALYLQQAMQEDEELIILCRTLLEIIS